MNKTSLFIATILALLFFITFAESKCYYYWGYWKCFDEVDEQSDADIRRNIVFSDKASKLAKVAARSGFFKSVLTNLAEEQEQADIKFGKLLKKIGLKLGKAYLRTQGIPLGDEEVNVLRRRRVFPKRRRLVNNRRNRRVKVVESDKFWKKLFKVVGQIGKGAIKSYVNQNFDEESDRFIRIGCC